MISDMIKIKKSRSRARLSSDAGSSSRQSLMTSASTETFTYMNPVSSSPPPQVHKKDKKEKGWQLKGRAPSNAARTHPPPLSLEDDEWKVDFVTTNLHQMEGIVKLPAPDDAIPPNGSAPIAVDSCGYGSSFQPPPSPPSSFDFVFNNPHPFSSTSPANKRNGIGDIRKVSPKSLPPSMAQDDTDASGLMADGTLSWTAPESWAVEDGKEEAPDATGDSSSEESTNINTRYTEAVSSLSSSSDPTSRRKSRRKTIHSRKPTFRSNSDRVRVRIYRADGTYHVAPISIHSTVAELTPSLNQKLLPNLERETHKLYLKERGRGTSFCYIFPTVPPNYFRACISAYGKAGCHRNSTITAGRL